MRWWAVDHWSVALSMRFFRSSNRVTLPLNTGVIATSRMSDELRVPIHPAHLDRIPAELRQRLTLERGYGERFGVSDADLAGKVGGLASREEILAACDVVILAKPVEQDLRELHEGGVLWGWPHCVQQEPITQAAIDRRLTLIAFEAMYNWLGPERPDMHIFSRNNELAGYCAVLHALHLRRLDGLYGPGASAAILSFGSVSRGAYYALNRRGFDDLAVYVEWPVHLVRDKPPNACFRRMRRGEPDRPAAVVDGPDGSQRPLVDVLAESDVIVNAILQDTDNPFTYMQAGDEARLKPDSLIIDVSCDRGMGFPFAKPTSFETPTFAVGPATYYGVDHTPSYLWKAASWEISDALLPYLATVMGGSERWAKNPTIARAIEIRDGAVENPKILSFQRRGASYPHLIEA